MMNKYSLKQEFDDGMRYWSYNDSFGYWSLPAHKIPFNTKEIALYIYPVAVVMKLLMRLHGTKAEIIKRWW